MEETKKKYMTIFFKKQTLDMDMVCTGRQNDLLVHPLTKEEMDLIYGKIIMEYNEYIYNYKSMFKIVKNEDETYKVEMKDEYKNELKQFL